MSGHARHAALGRLVPAPENNRYHAASNDKLRKSCGCEPTLLSARGMGESVKATDEVDADAAAANQISWLRKR
jgi:hypothetical protein